MKLIFTLASIINLTLVSAQTILNQMPKANNNIWAMVKDGNTIYIGGFFDTINGNPRSYLASFDCTTGTLNSWNPSIDKPVYALAIAGGKLMVGGEFQNVNGLPRMGICMFDLSTGNLDPWDGGILIPLDCYAIGSFNNNFYFSSYSPNGGGYKKIYCLDATTNNYLWHSDDSTALKVYSIVCNGNFVWAGGDLLNRYDINTGIRDSWSPSLSFGAFINSMVTIDSTLYIGGSYTTIEGQSRNGLSAFDADGNLKNFTIQSSSSQIWSLFPDGNFLWVGGNSSSFGGLPRYRMAQFDISTQQVTCWAPPSSAFTWGYVKSILVSNDTVYVCPAYASFPDEYLTVIKSTCIGNGIGENNSGPISISIFPNPSSNYFYVDLSNFSNTIVLKIYDIDGREIESHSDIIPVRKYAIGRNISNDGIYYLKISDRKNIITSRLIRIN